MNYTQLYKRANMKKVAASKRYFTDSIKNMLRKSTPMLELGQQNPRKWAGAYADNIAYNTAKSNNFRNSSTDINIEDSIQRPSGHAVSNKLRERTKRIQSIMPELSTARLLIILRNSPNKEWLQLQNILARLIKKYPDMKIRDIIPEEILNSKNNALPNRFLDQPLDRILGLYQPNNKALIGFRRSNADFFKHPSQLDDRYGYKYSGYPFGDYAPFDASFSPRYRATKTAWRQMQDLYENNLIPARTRDRFFTTLHPVEAEEVMLKHFGDKAFLMPLASQSDAFRRYKGLAELQTGRRSLDLEEAAFINEIKNPPNIPKPKEKMSDEQAKALLRAIFKLS